MAKCGDSYCITLNEAHLGWGTHRHTSTRPARTGERYLPIPIDRARAFEIYNSNATHGADVLGKNIFDCRSADDYLNTQLKAQGAARSGEIYAKQFSVNNDLRGLGGWYDHINAQPGDVIKVTWLSSTQMLVEKL